MDEYERGDEVLVEDRVESSFGKDVHTAIVVTKQQGSTPKRIKTSSIEAKAPNFEAVSDTG